MENIRNEFRWRMVKRKKQVVNYCMALGFLISFAGGNVALANDAAVSATTSPDFNSTLEGVTEHTQVDNDYNVKMKTVFAKDLYNSFDIGSAVSFNVSGGRTYVIKVGEDGGVSDIRGKINAPDIELFIQNSSGVTFHGSSQVNVGSLLATTARDIEFSGDEAKLSNFGDASIINEGNINVSDGGFAILAAPYVENAGVIKADLGRIVLASTTAMTVDLRGDGLITYGVTEQSLSKAGVKNTGTLQARSGVIEISANAASDIVDNVVNLDGVIDADSFGEGHDGGAVLISSKGDINMNDVVITANGGENGNGGKIETKAGGINNFSSDAVIQAKGGEKYGDGGFVDVSGTHISFNGDVDATAKNGKGGTLLIDPLFLKIRNGSEAFFDEGDGLILDIVYEKTIEFFSGLGMNVFLLANQSIVMENLADNTLDVGKGGITLQTINKDGSISFDDKNDSISATTGSIILNTGTGGIDIGHLSTQSDKLFGKFDIGSPGKITLTTTGDVATKSISIEGSPILGNASGVLSIDAKGDVLIDGDVNVDVAAKKGTSVANIDISSKKGDIKTGDISAKAEIVSLSISTGDGNIENGNVIVNDTDSKSKIPSSFKISANDGNIKIGDVETNVAVSLNATDDSFFQTRGNITTGNITSSENDLPVNIDAEGGVKTGDVNGKIRVVANDDVDTGNLVGDVAILTTDGNIKTLDITSDSGVLLRAKDASFFSTRGNVETGKIITTEANKLVKIIADGGVKTGEIRGDIKIAANDDVTVGNLIGAVKILTTDGNINTLDIQSDDGVSLTAGDKSLGKAKGNITTGGILTTDFDKKISIIAKGNVTTESLRGDVKVIANGGDIKTGNILSNKDVSLVANKGFFFGNGDVTTGHIRTKDANGNITITADGDVTTESLRGDINVVADGNIKAGNILSKANVSLDGNDVTIGNIGTEDANGNITILAGGNVKTNELRGSLDIDAQGNVETGDISTRGNVEIEGFDISTGNITVGKYGNSKFGDVVRTVAINAKGNTLVDGDISVDVSAKGTGKAVASINISADKTVTINGDVTATANSENDVVFESEGEDFKVFALEVAEGTEDDSTATASINIYGQDGVNINGGITSIANSESGDASASIDVSAGDVDSQSDVDIKGNMKSLANSLSANAFADLTITATQDILLSGVDDPMSDANSSFLQQRVTGVDSETDGTSTITITAGRDVRFFPEDPEEPEVPVVVVTPTPDIIDILVAKLADNNDNQQNNTVTGLDNLEPAGGGDDCDLMNCVEDNS
jgi:filamentous hemagglutinin family protein